MAWFALLWDDHGESLLYGALIVGAVLYIFRLDGLFILGRRYGFYVALVMLLFVGVAVVGERWGIAGSILGGLGLQQIMRLYKARSRETNS